MSQKIYVNLMYEEEDPGHNLQGQTKLTQKEQKEEPCAHQGGAFPNEMQQRQGRPTELFLLFFTSILDMICSLRDQVTDTLDKFFSASFGYLPVNEKRHR